MIEVSIVRLILTLVQVLILGIQIWALVNATKNKEYYGMNTMVAICGCVPTMLINLIIKIFGF